MPSPTSRTRLLVLIAILSCLTAIAAIVGNPQPAAAATCGDQVVVLGAPGSGQRGQGLNGLGAEVSYAYSDFVTQIRARGITKVRSQTVDYPADDVSVLSQLPSGPSQYFAGIDKGLKNTLAQLAQITSGFDASGATCSGARIVLMGYSQGAMVMHRALEALAPGGTAANPSLLDRIAGALLIADGDKMPGDVSLSHVFTPWTNWSLGLAQNVALRGVSGASGKAFSDRVRSKVFQVCRTGDVVCDSTATAAFIWNQPIWRQLVNIGKAIHSQSYKSSDLGAVPPLATQVANIVKAGSPTTTPPSTTNPPTSAPSGSNGHPAGDCGGRVQAAPQSAACLIVRQNVAVKPDNSNVSGIQQGFPLPDSVAGTGSIPPESVSALAALGLRIDGDINSAETKTINDVHLSGTPTAPPGIYPFDIDVKSYRTGTTTRLTFFIQIVPRSTPDA